MQGALWERAGEFAVRPHRRARVLRADLPYMLHGYGELQHGNEETSEGAWKCYRQVRLRLCVLFLARNANMPILSYHIDLNMDTVVTAVRQLFAFVTGIKPKFKVHGGSNAENLALQNIQVCQFSFAMRILSPNEKTQNNCPRPGCAWCSRTCSLS